MNIAVTSSWSFTVINADKDTNNQLLSVQDLWLTAWGLCIFISAS